MISSTSTVYELFYTDPFDPQPGPHQEPHYSRAWVEVGVMSVIGYS